MNQHLWDLFSQYVGDVKTILDMIDVIKKIVKRVHKEKDNRNRQYHGRHFEK